MLKGISPLISPDLLSALARMGHGDEIVLADAHFPGESLNANIIRADGLTVTHLLEAIIPLFELDAYVDNPLIMMQVVPGDSLDQMVETDYLDAIRKTNPGIMGPARIGRFEFYERARNAFAVVMTGETRKYGNIILKKGVTPS
jgi:L-fucose mutarotase